MIITTEALYANWGLVLFVIVTAVNVCGLLFDLCLLQCDAKTISDYSKIFPIITWIVVTWQFIGILGLLRHFLYE